MEWVETTSKTIEEAKDLLLDQLGVDEEEAEFEILEEPKVGLFGRATGQARVRARIQPKARVRRTSVVDATATRQDALQGRSPTSDRGRRRPR